MAHVHVRRPEHPNEQCDLETASGVRRRDFLKRLTVMGIGSLALSMPLTEMLGTPKAFAGIANPKGISPASSVGSYTVFAENGLVRALNNVTGSIDYSGPSATTVIQSAITALGGTGGKIFLRQGTYVVSTLESRGVSGVEIYGEGYSTVLRLANSVNKPVIFLSSVTNWNIHDLAIDGNKVNQSPSSTSCRAICAYRSTGVVISNNRVQDARTEGISLQSCNSSSVLNNYVTNCSANCISAGNPEGGSGSVIQGNTVDGASDVGISSDTGTDVLISDNIVRNVVLNESPFGWNSHAGIIAECNENGRNQRTTIRNNTVDNCPGPGISAYAPPASKIIGTVIEGNSIHNCGQGIYVENATDVMIRENIVGATTNASKGGTGVYVDRTATGTQIVGNDFSNLVGYSGISGSCNDLVIRSNTFKQVAFHAIAGYGVAGWLVADNVIANVIGSGNSGICISYSKNGVSSSWSVSNNRITGAGDGIQIVNSSSNVLNANQISGCTTGIRIWDSSALNNVVTSNIVAGNTVALVDKGTGTLQSNNTTVATLSPRRRP